MTRAVLLSFLAALCLTSTAAAQRARDIGVPFDGTPGMLNAITDVPGVLVGHRTVIAGEGDAAARTGVTAVIPVADRRPVFAAVKRHNGDGELTGSHFIQEKGYFFGPVLMTNTVSVGTVHEAVIRWSQTDAGGGYGCCLPVVGETWDGDLNDIFGFHVQHEHVFDALNRASSGPVAEGNVGGGTGMMAHAFKGGIGTSSRVLSEEAGGFVVGALVQANYGRRSEFRVAGVPVGREISDLLPEISEPLGDSEYEDGSIIVVIGTDAPLLPGQLERVTERVAMGLARTGSFSSTYSGDIFLAFSTQPVTGTEEATRPVQTLVDGLIDDVFLATVQVTEEAVINALVAAETMTGYEGHTVHALPHDRLRSILERYGRLREQG
ncbi:MAG: P1 family peptidase [Gemmatimonadota bacterium]